MSSFETAVERVKEVAGKLAPDIKLRIAAPYYDDPYYIKALVGSASGTLGQDYDHLLLSFHGLPERHLRKANPGCNDCLRVHNCCEQNSAAHSTCYRVQCFKTAEAFTRKAGVTRYSIAFQSRLGREPWLQPYTDQELVRLAKDGLRKLLVICPAFVADCLETLEEIGMRGREIFLEAGGEKFTMIPCLNDHPLWIEALEKMIQPSLQAVLHGRARLLPSPDLLLRKLMGGDIRARPEPRPAVSTKGAPSLISVKLCAPP